MTTLEKSRFEAFLSQQDEACWRDALKNLLPDIHPVDQDATRIWFSFWPLQLHHIVQQSQNLEETARRLELQGEYRLSEQPGSSASFLFGARYWSPVQQAVRAHADNWQSEEAGLAGEIRAIVQALSGELRISPSQLMGITAVALMTLQQVGRARFDTATVKTPLDSSPEELIRTRSQRRRRFFDFLRTVDARHTVVFDERDPAFRFEAIHGQDLSMAAGQDVRDYRTVDARRVEGPIPFQCRIGTCGTCWVGLLAGKERLSPIDERERQALERFGYDFGNDTQETHPPVRLACQAKCLGDVTLTIAPWNGILRVQRYEDEGGQPS